MAPTFRASFAVARESMLVPGKHFSLDRPTIAIGLEDGKRVVILVPTGAVIEVLPGFTEGDVTVEVMWASLPVTMFTVDIEERGRTVQSQKKS